MHLKLKPLKKQNKPFQNSNFNKHLHKVSNELVDN